MPACFFTAADVDQLQKETGVDGGSIHTWASIFRERVKTVKREQVEEYLSTVTIVVESDGEKVKCFFAATCCVGVFA